MAKQPRRVGLIGLGAGTLATYGNKGDIFRFYDINAAVVEIAKRDFTYLKESDATIEVSLGDARLNLERESPQQFDVLAIDAFSSDSIPVHLITLEALDIYAKHMKPDGVIAFHVSNRFLDLKPVVQMLADKRGWHTAWIRDVYEDGSTTSDWVLVTRHKPILLRSEMVESTYVIPPEPGLADLDGRLQQSAAGHEMSANAPQTDRACQPCTACCDGWVRINVFEQPVLPGKPCPHSRGPIGKHGGGGCSIYAERPVDPCVQFACGWVKPNSHLPDWMKPSEAKVIVLPAWTTWRTFPVDLALPVGPVVPFKALKWLQAYSKAEFRPLIYTEQEVDRNGHYTGEQRVLGYGPPTFQQEMASLLQGRRLG